MRQLIKSIVNAICVVIVLPCIVTTWLEGKVTRGETVYLFWAHVLAVQPGHPGAFLRRAFYRYTLAKAEGNFFVGFGAVFTHRKAQVHRDVYIGPYALIGGATIGEGTLVGSRASLLSGTNQHELGEDGTWQAFDSDKVDQIRIGRNVWIGEGAIIMADIGDTAMISAGSVIGTKVKSGVAMAGNPARFVRKLELPVAAPTQAAPESEALSEPESDSASTADPSSDNTAAQGATSLE